MGFSRAIVTVLSIASILIGCASGTHIPTMPTAVRMEAPAGLVLLRAGGPKIPALVFSNYLQDRLDFFDSNGKQYGYIKTPVAGSVAMDNQGDIYLENENQYGGPVRVYSPPYDRKPQILSLNNYGYPNAGIAVDSKTGVAAVLIFGFTPNDPGYVVFIRHGQSSPCVAVPAPTYLWAAAFDAAGVLYLTNAGGTILSIAGQCNAKTFVAYGPTLSYIQTLQFNAKNELVVQPEWDHDSTTITTYAHPQSGRPLKALSVTNLDSIGPNPSIMMTFSSSGHTLWAEVLDLTYGRLAAAQFVGLYNYPAGGAPISQISPDGMAGAAVYPPLQP